MITAVLTLILVTTAALIGHGLLLVRRDLARDRRAVPSSPLVHVRRRRRPFDFDRDALPPRSPGGPEREGPGASQTPL